MMADMAVEEKRVGAERIVRVRRKWNWEGWAAVAALAIAWQLASTQLPHILFPPLQDIVTTFVKLTWQGDLIDVTGHTYLRILVALSLSFAISTGLGLLGGIYAPIDRAMAPLVQIKQGVPTLCWIIFSIIWFKDVEVRNGFIVIISTLPSFYYLARDGIRAIPSDLWEMVRAWRPTAWQILTKLIIPSILPNFITGLRLNIGAAARATVFAELLGGISGVGYQLRVAEEQFRMADVLAWTVVLVFWILVTDRLLSIAETRLLNGRGRKDNADA